MFQSFKVQGRASPAFVIWAASAASQRLCHFDEVGEIRRQTKELAASNPVFRLTLQDAKPYVTFEVSEVELRAHVPEGLSRKEAEVYLKLDAQRLPKHIAIIMDGNGRWAKRRHLPRIAGHRSGAETVREIVQTAARIGLPALTLYAFSEENWKKRPKTEVAFLMALLRRYLKNEVPLMNRNNIRLQFIGRQHELPLDVQESMNWARQATAHNTGMILTLALNYSARSEIVDAFNSIVKSAMSNGGPGHLSIDENAISRNLYTSHLPELDLVIRTSGEMRLSNFLLWQVAYAEIYVTNLLWPDFSSVHLLEAIAEFQKRERRYGGLVEHSTHEAQAQRLPDKALPVTAK